MTKLRVGVIGAGAIAQSCHIPGYAASEHCELTAIADPASACLEMVTQKGYQFANQYTDYRQMLENERLDVVSICTPNTLHREMAVAALQHGCDVLLEKPAAVTVAEAEAIRTAVRSSGRQLMMGFSHRFSELNQAARAALAADAIGKPYMARIRFAHNGPWPGWAKTDWFYRPEISGGGVVLDMAVHAFDLLHWYIGPITAVQAQIGTLRKDIAVEDNAVIIVEFGASCLGYVEAGWTSRAGFSGVELMGDKGAIKVDYATESAVMTAGEQTPEGKFKTQTTTLAEGYKKTLWQTEMAAFIAALRHQTPMQPDIDAGVAAVQVVQAVYESARTGCRVTL